MERIEVNVETGKVSIVQLSTEEILASQQSYSIWESQQQSLSSPPTIGDLQSQIQSIMSELNAIKSKVGA
jgi:hypothetical protein